MTLSYFQLFALGTSLYIEGRQCTKKEINSKFRTYTSWTAGGAFSLSMNNCGKSVSLEKYLYKASMPTSYLSCSWNLVDESIDPNFQGDCSQMCLDWQINNVQVVQQGKGCTGVTPTGSPTSSPIGFPTRSPTDGIPSPSAIPSASPSQTLSPSTWSVSPSFTRSPTVVVHPTSPTSSSPSISFPPSTLPSTSHPSSSPSVARAELTTGSIIGIAIGSTVFVLLLATCCCYREAFLVAFCCIKRTSSEDNGFEEELNIPVATIKYDIASPDEKCAHALDYWNSRGFLTQETETYRMYVDRGSGEVFWVSKADDMRYDYMSDLPTTSKY